MDRPELDRLPPPQLPPPSLPPDLDPEKRDGLTIASLVLSISGALITLITVGLFFFIGLPCSILGLVFGVKRRANRIGKAGMIIGIVGIALTVLIGLLWTAFFIDNCHPSSSNNDPFFYCD